ncbi:hypothetical protein D8674_018498 [Pyrus ussuriensis x Pyrus communis]|uniref:Uncharacterized protein n=1 Tax=Pyrus ussuriensis x Pyrus communis TaxID=2448454 RepID=A0A5N5G514_9ROSA|nr:hypothetical protein D8674_018498 [Pyrus ussuriensis x Pyrus communis]
MKTYFLAEDLWDVVEGTVKEPPEAEGHKAWQKKDAKGLYAIQNSCGDGTYPLIEYRNSAEATWRTFSLNLKRAGGASDESGTYIDEKLRRNIL